MEHRQLYNIRLIKSYLEYIEKFHPDVEIDTILEYAGISRYELQDMGYWFTQEQSDRFYEIVVRLTGNYNIAREAGRLEATSASYDTFRQYVFGFIKPVTAYAVVSRLADKLTRGGQIECRKIEGNKVELVATPASGVQEQAYQCQNRTGVLEALAKPFNGKFAQVEHPECLHRGDSCCRYLISWDNPSFFVWKKIASWGALLAVLGAFVIHLMQPELNPLLYIMPLGSLVLLSAFYSENLEKQELVRNITAQGNAAEQLFSEINVRYNDALLIQEIGQAISMILNIRDLIEYLMHVLEKRSGFDRGMVLLSSDDGRGLSCMNGFGYTEEQMKVLSSLTFNLGGGESRGPLIKAYRTQTACIINNVDEVLADLSPRSRKLVESFDLHSMVCVPIVYKGESLGVLSVDNTRTMDSISQTELSLLTGIAQQIGISINNARSFQQLQASEAQYRELVETANSIIMRIDLDGRIKFLNSFAQTFFDVDDLINQNLIGTIIPAHTPAARVFSEICQRQESSNAVQTEIKHPGEKAAWISWTIKAISDRSGDVYELLCIGSDMSSQKQLENQLRQSQKMEAIGTLAGGIAHDFNNILFPIIGYAEMSMDDVPRDSLVHSNLEEIFIAAKRAKELVEQILIFSRQSEFEIRPLLVQPVVKEVLKLMRASLPSTIRIVPQIDGNCRPVMADPTQIHQIMMNLCSNAAHAMRDRGGVLMVKLYESDDCCRCASAIQSGLPRGCVVLEIRDEGHGIGDDIMDKIFDPYFTTKGPQEGSGMGLAVVHGIVRSYGGHLEVDSKVGQGTCIRVFIPALDRSMVDFKPDLQRQDLERGDERILLVDDEEFVVQMSQQMLSRLGYDVTAASGSLEALEIFSRRPAEFDLVLTDHTMPHMTGMEMAEKMLAIRKDIPIILCTGFSEGLSEERVRERGIREFVMKPLATREISAAIRRTLDA